MHLLFHFYLVHFIADYPLQPYKLVKYKKESLLGIFIHTLIHLAVMLIVMIPFLHLKAMWIAIAFTFITHNIIDYSKIQLDKKYPELRLPLYLTDQICHILIATLCVSYLGIVTPVYPEWMAFYPDSSVILFLLCLTLSTFFFDVTRYFFRSAKDMRPYKRSWGLMTINALIVTIAFGVYWIFY